MKNTLNIARKSKSNVGDAKESTISQQTLKDHAQIKSPKYIPKPSNNIMCYNELNKHTIQLSCYLFQVSLWSHAISALYLQHKIQITISVPTGIDTVQTNNSLENDFYHD